jgi:hypothetical protein
MVRVDREVHRAIQLLVGANVAKGLPVRIEAALQDLISKAVTTMVYPHFPRHAHHAAV